ncbi:type III toxin-antitoxin system TenpIN family toxin [Allofournierella massiliensis]|uniref:Uncharacterized protein n=1 Tax=Allofournierella massiliensis TaxID=1650663 RepID=A0A4R1R7N0_9FIRM|nr:hypothetical protein [Fournierella massiliensis]TCL61635.1 hypothetical protein EDD77_10189 [Fournierella massiliensis]
MEYLESLYLLSQDFMQDYPASVYPELMHKQGRPYSCLLIETHEGYFICVPFRSSIGHKNAFLFTGTARSKAFRSGLDYSKIVIVKESRYLDSNRPAVVDQDEYNEMRANLPKIVEQVNRYVCTYMNHVTGKKTLHQREYTRKYGFSTLPYFHDILGIP